MIGDYRGESSNENREKQLHLRTPRLYQREKRETRRMGNVRKYLLTVMRLILGREGDRGGRLPTG